MRDHLIRWRLPGCGDPGEVNGRPCGTVVGASKVVACPEEEHRHLKEGRKLFVNNCDNPACPVCSPSPADIKREADLREIKSHWARGCGREIDTKVRSLRAMLDDLGYNPGPPQHVAFSVKGTDRSLKPYRKRIQVVTLPSWSQMGKHGQHAELTALLQVNAGVELDSAFKRRNGKLYFSGVLDDVPVEVMVFTHGTGSGCGRLYARVREAGKSHPEVVLMRMAFPFTVNRRDAAVVYDVRELITFRPVSDTYHEKIQTREGYRAVRRELRRIQNVIGYLAGVNFFHPFRFRKYDDPLCTMTAEDHRRQAEGYEGKWVTDPHFHAIILGKFKVPGDVVEMKRAGSTRTWTGARKGGTSWPPRTTSSTIRVSHISMKASTQASAPSSHTHGSAWRPPNG